MQNEPKIAERAFNFSISIRHLYKILIAANEYVISKQLLRSACSIGANVEEAGAVISKKDFINKMAIASKEARETKYWLLLLEKSQIVKLDYSDYLAQVTSIVNVLTKIVKTAQQGG